MVKILDTQNRSLNDELENLSYERLVQIVRDKDRELTITETKIHDLQMLLEKKQLKINNLLESLEEIAADAEEASNQSRATYEAIRDTQLLNDKEVT